jgi:DNA repair protein RadA/Sms
MAKLSSVFVCQNCGAAAPRWSGQCPSCGEWNTLVETAKPQQTTSGSRSIGGSQRKAFDPKDVLRFKEVGQMMTPKPRISTGMAEFDRVLGADKSGAGMVPGAVMLIGGEPGIGKSTLLTQLVVELLSVTKTGEKVKKTPITKTLSPVLKEQNLLQPILYVSGEESPSQIALRIKRILNDEHISLDTKILENSLIFATNTDVDQLLTIIEAERPSLVIVDSIQTLSTEDLMGSSGSVGQLRESAERITEVVKKLDIPTFLVGHVTKEGTIAGPKVLEHIVDAVLELSGERTGQLRLLRAIKNRFGATDEVGVFQVHEYGLAEVKNPSEIFLEQIESSRPGSATVCVVEGTRPLLVEVQALVVESQLAMPRRVGRGVQLPRIQLLAAVLQKHCRLPLGTADIFLNVAGGFSVNEPAVDLGLAMAIVSSLKNIALPPKTVFIGEVGLLGEVRKVSYLERRTKEAKRLGFTTVISRETHPSLSKILKDLGL